MKKPEENSVVLLNEMTYAEVLPDLKEKLNERLKLLNQNKKKTGFVEKDWILTYMQICVLIEDLGGISPREPGFKDSSVHPHLPKSLAKPDMRVPLPDGRHVEFEWDKGFYNWRLLK